MPQDFVASAIIQAVRSLPKYPQLDVLDLSCGRGEVLAPLVRDGVRGRGTHYRSDDYKLADLEEPLYTDLFVVDPDVDLTAGLPYEDGSFDVVILSEVIEHLRVHWPALAEFARVLRPGGHIVISTPNLLRLHSRLHYFLTGTHKLIRRRVGWDLDPESLYQYHINPPDFALLHSYLHFAGFRITTLRFTRFKARHAWLLLLYPFVLAAVALETSGRPVDERHRAGERDLRRWLSHPAALASEQLLLVARKDVTS